LWSVPEETMLNIDRNSPLPLHYQLKQLLLQKIDSGEWGVGALIPSELELQETYGLSRTTVRQALMDLVFEGRLIRERGRGTFVAPPKMTHSPEERRGLTQFMTEQGIKPGWRILEQGWVEATPEVAEKLAVAPKARVYRIHRLRLANDEPIGSHVAYVPEIFAGQVDAEALKDGESTRYLGHVPQIQNSRAHRTIEAVAALEADARQLGVNPGTPILQIERVTLAPDGTPIEFLQARYRGDRFKYQITL
jgi:GntR family transcriptional regulator